MIVRALGAAASVEKQEPDECQGRLLLFAQSSNARRLLPSREGPLG